MILLLITLIIMQFIRPEKNQEGYVSVEYFENETRPSASVSAILRESCYDCHSNHTQYPWYAEFSPISLWLNEHITDGKEHFNVSAWEEYSIKKKEHKIEELIEMVEQEEMPLKSYAFLHGNLTDDQRKLLLQWAGLVRLRYKHLMEVSAK